MFRSAGANAADSPYPILCDPAFTVSATYGVAFQMRIHTERSNRPATFIIDGNGILRYERRGRTFGDRPRVNEIVAQLQKLK